jgi:hypothetical protein
VIQKRVTSQAVASDFSNYPRILPESLSIDPTGDLNRGIYFLWNSDFFLKIFFCLLLHFLIGAKRLHGSVSFKFQE